MINSSFIKFLYLFGLATFLISPAFSQNKEESAKSDPNIEFVYQKNSDNSYSLICNLGVSKDKEIVPVANAVVDFYTGEDYGQSLGSGVTNKKGRAVCTIPANYKIPLGTDRKFSFKVIFPGNEKLNSGEEVLRLIDLKMEMNFSEKDTSKTIQLKAYSLNKNGNKIPLTNTSVNIYVPRMFSQLKIAEAKLDSSGQAEIYFPAGIPGDSAGNLKIIARVEDNTDFGNVEKSAIKKWGKMASRKYLVIHRALWTAIAPIWMIISLTIMLVGVWAHYLYVIVRLIWVSRQGNKKPLVEVF